MADQWMFLKLEKNLVKEDHLVVKEEASIEDNSIEYYTLRGGRKIPSFCLYNREDLWEETDDPFIYH